MEIDRLDIQRCQNLARQKNDALKKRVVDMANKNCRMWRIKIGRYKFAGPDMITNITNITEDPTKFNFLCQTTKENDPVCVNCPLNSLKGGVVIYS